MEQYVLGVPASMGGKYTRMCLEPERGRKTHTGDT